MFSSNGVYSLNHHSTLTDSNPHTCVALRNKRIAHVAATPQELRGNRVVHSYFTTYGKEAVRPRTGLSQPLIDFLEQIDVFIQVHEDCEGPKITPHLRIAEPSKLLEALFCDFQDEESDIFYNTATLYAAAIGEYDDLYFDMDTSLCTLHQQPMPLPHEWYPLERALAQFESLIRSGQWTVGPAGVKDSIEKWRDADTSRHAEKYRLGACFDE